MVGDWTTVRGGIWIGRGGTYAWETGYGAGLIEVRGTAYSTVTEAAILDAPASAIAVMSSTNAEVSRTLVRAARGRAILISESPWAVVMDSIIEAPRFDGISLLVGSTYATVTRNRIDYSDTREWSYEPWATSCGYAQGIVAWGGATSASVTWNTILGPGVARPECHLFIGISLATKSDWAIGRQNVVDGQAGIDYCLEIADVSDVTLDTNWVRGCSTAGISVVHGDTYTGRPTAGARVQRNLVEETRRDGISIGGHVQGARAEGNTVRGAGVPINVWTLAGGTPSGVELADNLIVPTGAR